MNISKILRWNLSHPIEKRLSVQAISEAEAIAAVRGNLFALREEIQKDIAPLLAEKLRADGMMDRIGSTSGCYDELCSSKNQGFGFDLAKYSNSPTYRLRVNQEPDLASENSPMWAMVERIQQLKEKQLSEKLEEDFGE